jgi:hypothetical protein
VVLVLSKNAGLLAHVAHRPCLLRHVCNRSATPPASPAARAGNYLEVQAAAPSKAAVSDRHTTVHEGQHASCTVHHRSFPAIYSAAFKGLYTANLFVKFTKPSRHCKLNKHLNIDNRTNLKCSTISCHYTRLALA